MQFFGLFSFFSRITGWSGTLVFTLINEAFDSLPLAVISTDFFFVVAFLIMTVSTEYVNNDMLCLEIKFH